MELLTIIASLDNIALTISMIVMWFGYKRIRSLELRNNQIADKVIDALMKQALTNQSLETSVSQLQSTLERQYGRP